MTGIVVGSDSAVLKQATLTAINSLMPGYARPLDEPAIRPSGLTNWGLSYFWPLINSNSSPVLWMVPKTQFDEQELLNAVRLIALQRLGRVPAFRLVFPRVTSSTKNNCTVVGGRCRDFKLVHLLQGWAQDPNHPRMHVELVDFYLAGIACVIHGFDRLVQNVCNIYHCYLNPFLQKLGQDFVGLNLLEFSTWPDGVLRDLGSTVSMSEETRASWNRLKIQCDAAASRVLRTIREKAVAGTKPTNGPIAF